MAFDPAWLTESVRSMWAAIVKERDLGSLPVLADALEEASCTNAAFLAFCRSGVPFPGKVAPNLASFVDLTARWQAFLDTYAVLILSDHEGSFTIPEGKSRMDLLNDAQLLSRALYDQAGTCEETLAEWATEERFRTPVTAATTRRIDGKVPGSNNMNRFQQEHEGWNDVDLEDLAAAHQVYWIAARKDLFGDHFVRVRGGRSSLSVRHYQLAVYLCDDFFESDVTWASRSLPSPT